LCRSRRSIFSSALVLFLLGAAGLGLHPVVELLPGALLEDLAHRVHVFGVAKRVEHRAGPVDAHAIRVEEDRRLHDRVGLGRLALLLLRFLRGVVVVRAGRARGVGVRAVGMWGPGLRSFGLVRGAVRRGLVHFLDVGVAELDDLFCLGHRGRGWRGRGRRGGGRLGPVRLVVHAGLQVGRGRGRIRRMRGTVCARIRRRCGRRAARRQGRRTVFLRLAIGNRQRRPHSAVA
jgi:hypothetical protein